MEKIFANGIIFKRPRDGAPSFVKGSLSIKGDEFIPFIQKNMKDGWVNIDLKESQGGKLYFELNTWTKESVAPKPEVPTIEYPESSINPDSIPF